MRVRRRKREVSEKEARRGLPPGFQPGREKREKPDCEASRRSNRFNAFTVSKGSKGPPIALGSPCPGPALALSASNQFGAPRLYCGGGYIAAGAIKWCTCY